MKQTKEVYAGGFYLLTGEASANSCFIESLSEAKIFIRLSNRYLHKYIKIHEYLLTAEAWMIQIRIRSDKKVQAAYYKKRKKLGKSVNRIETWRIISEQVRLMLAHYVRLTNKIENRQGSKVKESYKRYYFESAKEANLIIEKMKSQKWKLIQRNPKYRKVKNHYRIPKKIGKGSLFLCSKDNNKKEYRVKMGTKRGFKNLITKLLNHKLLATFIESTIISHKSTNSS